MAQITPFLVDVTRCVGELRNGALDRKAAAGFVERAMISITHPTARDMALYAVYLVVVIDIFASALSVPIMPFYVRTLCRCTSADVATSCEDPVCKQLGGATASLGFMFSSFAIAQLVSNAWLGPLSDAVGRKAILTLTLSGACSCRECAPPSG